MNIPLVEERYAVSDCLVDAKMSEKNTIHTEEGI